GSLLGSLLKYNALEDFVRRLPRSLLTKSSHMSSFHNISEHFESSDGVFFHIKWSPSLSL
ncbi:unnamed protein product, partial [Brassica rapa]